VIDVPTDLATMSDAYRMSRRHADDVRAVVSELKKRYPALLVYLIGTSRGTVSAAYAGAALGEAVDGVVLTSTVFNASRGGPGVSGFDWDTIHSRLLFVHHVDDACGVTPYSMARRVAVGRTLVSVHGGDAPRSDPCEPYSAHGYLGVEAPVINAVVQWMRGEAPPGEVP
jgi:pimeloyl-ACP methyl ester carboxylesterase